MQLQEQIAELQARIDQLKLQQDHSRKELIAIQQQLLQLRAIGNPLQTNTQPSPQVNSSAQKGIISSFGLEKLVGLRLIQFAGIIVLIIGIAIGVKYAIDKNLITAAGRIGLAYAAAGLLLFFSVLLRKRYEGFSAILFSGAMAAFYFTTYGAFEYYGFLSRPIAFILMMLLTFLAVFISLKYNRQEIAILALVGSYGIPFLVGGNSGNVFMLFTYIFLINCGILLISFRRNWHLLKILSFAFSWVILLSWLFIRYDAGYQGTAWLFICLFFIQFLFTVTGFRIFRKQEPDAGDLVLLILLSVFLYSSSAYLYSYKGSEDDISFITLVMSVLHLLFAFTGKTVFTNQKLIWHTYLVLSLALFIVYVPLKFEATTITIVWVFTAVVLFLIGLWQRFRIFRVASILLFSITLLKLVVFDSAGFSTIEKIISYVSIGAILLVIAFLYQKYRHLIFRDDE